MTTPKVAIIIYTVHGHVGKREHHNLTESTYPDRHRDIVAEAIKQGVAQAGGAATIYQIPGTTTTTYPILSPNGLANFDAFLFGIPTRFGNFPAEWKIFWDATDDLWWKAALEGKFAGVFVSTGTAGGGQETTIINSISTLTNHGIIYVPLGYGRTLELFANVKEVHGGSPWGAGAIAGTDDKREVSAVELEIAKQQGIGFWEVISKHRF
ncbi:flavoprotein-like protein [Boletus coccyginus]|nr:flavoprotein-like protein [Boletus coccyginus]